LEKLKYDILFSCKYCQLSSNRKINFAKVLGIVELKTSTLDIAAQIYADLKNDGNIIEDDDIFIGATALENDAILVTNNERHLGRIKDLKYEVWS
jgi:predicted nucleic acid-binding protein